VAGGKWQPTGSYTHDNGAFPNNGTFNWGATPPTITIGANTYPLDWIYDGWMEYPAPSAIYGSLSNHAASPLSYSCGRCHSTGWTSNAVIQNGSGSGILDKEPEKSFPGISYSTTNTTGWVNLKGSVGADPSLYSSWDAWGISCARCHSSGADTSSAVSTNSACYLTQYNQAGCLSPNTWDTNGVCKNTTARTPDACKALGGYLGNLSSAAGHGHNNGMTTFDAGSGYCSDSTVGSMNECAFIGGTWFTGCSKDTGSCSDGVSTTLAACVAASGSCSIAGFTTAKGCYLGGGIWTPSGSPANTWTPPNQRSCVAGGGVWSVSSCSTNSDLGKAYCTTPNTTYTTQALCTGYIDNNSPQPPVGSGVVITGTWTNVTAAYPNQTACNAGGAGYVWASNACSVCYTRDLTYANAAACKSASLAAGVGAVWVNSYSNDPDSCEDAGGKYTGSKANRGQIITALCMNCHRQETSGLPNGATSTWDPTNKVLNVNYSATDPAGTVTVGPYHSTVTLVSHPHGNMYLNSPHGKFTGTFDQIAVASNYTSHLGYDTEAANTGFGCTACHNIHKSTVEGVGQEGAVKECTECHAGAYAKSLTAINHPSGVGTPLQDYLTDPASACETCHMPEGMHFFRINTNPTYSWFPTAAMTSNQPATTEPDGTYAKAVWVDLDKACGQCHGGGNGHFLGSGSFTNLSPAVILTAGQGVNFAAGDRVKISGANYVGGSPVDLTSYVKTVVGDTLTLAGNAAFTGSGAVEKNPLANGATYKSKMTLAGLAVAMHPESNRTPGLPTLNFGLSTNGLLVTVNASASSCNGGNPCDLYSWNWGDATADTTGVSQTHTYAAAGHYTITLTAKQYGITGGTISKVANVVAIPAPPVAGGSCSYDPNTWTVTVTDATAGATKEAVVWGDGLQASDTTSPFGPFTHTYFNPGTFTVTQKVWDANGLRGQVSWSANCGGNAVVAANFTISGTVFHNDGVTPAPGAVVRIKLGATPVRTVYGAPTTGLFSVGSLKPGTYTLDASMTGATYGATVNVTVGASQSGVVVKVP